MLAMFSSPSRLSSTIILFLRPVQAISVAVVYRQLVGKLAVVVSVLVEVVSGKNIRGFRTLKGSKIIEIDFTFSLSCIFSLTSLMMNLLNY